MAQHNITAYAAPSSGATGWNGPLETFLAAALAAINDTDSYTDPRKAKLNDRGTWQANTAYAVGDKFVNANEIYVVTVPFTSGSSFSSTNCVDMGPATSGSSTSTPGVLESALTATYAWPCSLTGAASNLSTPTLSRLVLGRLKAGRAVPSGTNWVASWFQNAAVASSFFRTGIYKLDPANGFAATLVADLGQVDTSVGTAAVKTSAAVAAVAAVAQGDMLAFGGVAQGVAPTIQVVSGGDPGLPSTAGPATGARPSGLYLDGVTGALPATIPGLGAGGGLSVLQTGSSVVPLIYMSPAA